MNLPLRLAECSLPYICVINGYYGVFVAIHFAHDKWFVRCMLDILLYVKTPFLHYKKGVFERQKPYFCIAKRGFLKNNNIVVCVASVVIRLEYI